MVDMHDLNIGRYTEVPSDDTVIEYVPRDVACSRWCTTRLVILYQSRPVDQAFNRATQSDMISISSGTEVQ